MVGLVNFRTNFYRDPNRYEAKTRMVCRGKPVKSWIRKSSKHPVFYQLLGGSRVWILVLFNFVFFFPNLEFLNGNSIAFQIISNCVDRSDPLENYKKNLDGPQVLQSQQNHIFESFAAHPWSYKLALAGNNSFSPSRWLGFFRDTSRTLSQNKNQGTP